MTVAATDAVHNVLVEAILRVRDEWLAGSNFDASEINCGAHPRGCCSDFVAAVYQDMGGLMHAYDLGISEVGIDGFMTESPDGILHFDRDLIKKHWPDFAPPDGFSWDDMDRLSEDANFHAGTHEWMTVGGRHYDAECPNGVSNPFDLPFLKRVISSWTVDGPSRPAAIR